MRVRASRDGVTVRAIAGTSAVILAMDLAPAMRAGCLGFSIERTDLDAGGGRQRWLPNLLRFQSDLRPPSTWVTTATAPLQRFRWGDYTVEPGRRYRYRVVARRGETPAQVVARGTVAEKTGKSDSIPGGVMVEVRTEDNRMPGTAVFFNRGAAASKAYIDQFGNSDPEKIPAAKVWLSRGLEEGLLDFIGRAEGADFALHAVIYEFQKPSLLAGLKAAAERGASVEVVYHARKKADARDKKTGEVKEVDHTLGKNEAAIQAAGIGAFCQRRAADPAGAIMHDKYVVLLSGGMPMAVWTGSTNWTDGGIYGQLNVGHAVYDPTVAECYERSFQMLRADPDPAATKQANKAITPVPDPPTRAALSHGITPLFSPQNGLAMLDLYADVCRSAKLLMVSAPFELHQKIMDALKSPADSSVLRFVLADTARSMNGGVQIMNRDPHFAGAIATTLKSPLHDFQNRILEKQENFHHRGIHIHTKVIAADPFGADPVLIMGSANFSENSTDLNDSNVLVFRGDTAIMDIYVTEFMRMFDHYWFRFRLAQSETKAAAHPAAAVPPGGSEPPLAAPTAAAMEDPLKAGLALKDDASWSDPAYVPASREERERLAFIGAV